MIGTFDWLEGTSIYQQHTSIHRGLTYAVTIFQFSQQFSDNENYNYVKLEK